MIKLGTARSRFLSVAGFSFLSAYILSFLFEGQILYSLLELHKAGASVYIVTAIVPHFAGLFTCGYLVKSPRAIRFTMLAGMGLCLLATVPFFFIPSVLWAVALITAGYISGCTVASWGYYLKTFTPKKERIKSCADVLIFSNLIMIGLNVVALNFSPFMGLALSMFSLVIGMVLLSLLPAGERDTPGPEKKDRPRGEIGKPLLFLCLFIFVITINSGLMYEVINPAFGHLTGLVSWYWALPYIVALIIMRNLPSRDRSGFLYLGMAMIMAAFIAFMLLERSGADYLVIDTLMLGACGIFDLFWWSILGEILDHSANPVKIFGAGLSANVFGVLGGGLLGMAITSIKLPGAEMTVIALTVVCVTLILLPPLNRQLVMLLKNHAYLSAYDRLGTEQRAKILRQTKSLEALTPREEEVLQEILLGKSNRQISSALFISESTVKTHTRNIFSKYDVGSRAELISTLLKN